MTDKLTCIVCGIADATVIHDVGNDIHESATDCVDALRTELAALRPIVDAAVKLTDSAIHSAEWRSSIDEVEDAVRAWQEAQR